ncbi:hypothetical protein B6V00_02230 [ANME-1 cluster archaeon ex4572_4]|nr:DUF5402 family protein [Methanophagales archaeon]OYT66964.1 MAG: hypothetical protein B6V00_02230 [ANME-1 cluster archaeon ex4572_4]PXF51474.1 MAG: hypothetical protein C4B55_03575 [Methanophagales archaeon]
MKEELKEGRKRLEAELRRQVGNVFVPEAKVFGMVCGCVGFAADLRGLRSDDVEVFGAKITGTLEEISRAVGVEPEFVYARKLPGSEEVVTLTARELCERCKKEFAGSKAPPRPDILVLKRLKG